MYVVTYKRVQSIIVAFIGNDWPPNGVSWSADSDSFFIAYVGMPYNGHIHKFYAHIKSTEKVRFQIWRQNVNTKHVTLIGERSITPTEAALESTFYEVCVN